mgnify:FL=1
MLRGRVNLPTNAPAMPCTLDAYTDFLISSNGPATATNLSRLHQGAISHDQVTRWLASDYLDSKKVWAHAKPLIKNDLSTKTAQDFAVLIVDDSLLEKPHTDPNAMVARYWDHCSNTYVKAVNFMSLLYQTSGLCVPIAVQFIEKTEEVFDSKTMKFKFVSAFTKNEYLQQMLAVAQQQLDYEFLLGDTWYSSTQNMNCVLGLKHQFIFALETSRTAACSEAERQQGKFVRLDALAFVDQVPLRVFLRSVKQAVLVVKQVFTNKDGSQGVLYLVCSDTGLSYEQITTIYQRRWKVEEYHKSLKQNASMGNSPTRTMETQANHLFASVLAFIKLEALRIKLTLNQFKIKALLYIAGLKASYQELAILSA